jgi:chaperonin GroES
MKIRPLNDRVLVLPKEPDEKSKGGIILTPTSQKRPNEGKVVAVGKGRVLADGRQLKPIVEVGQTVVYEPNAGQEIIIDGTTHLFFHEEQLLAVYG